MQLDGGMIELVEDFTYLDTTKITKKWEVQKEVATPIGKAYKAFGGSEKVHLSEPSTSSQCIGPQSCQYCCMGWKH